MVANVEMSTDCQLTREFYPELYKDESISVITHDGLHLSGFIAVPPGSVRGVALLLSGSGPVDHDGDVSSPFVGTGYRGQSAKLNLQLVQELARLGIATLRYAKRGAEFPAEIKNHTVSNLVEDAKRALEVLNSRFPALPTMCVGFSEGALISLLLAKETPAIGSLFFLGIPSQSIDELFYYQFVGWPIDLLLRKIDLNQDGSISREECAAQGVTHLPILGSPIHDLPFDSEGIISVLAQIRPIYEEYYAQVRGLLATPEFAAWYESMKSLPSLSELLQGLDAPTYFYQGSEDAQIYPPALPEALASLTQKSMVLRKYPNLGHCFAPMEGAIGEKKTSGPFDRDFLEQLVTDIGTVLANRTRN